MGTPLGPKYLPYTYMDPFGLGFMAQGFGSGGDDPGRAQG